MFFIPTILQRESKWRVLFGGRPESIGHQKVGREQTANTLLSDLSRLSVIDVKERILVSIADHS